MRCVHIGKIVKKILLSTKKAHSSLWAKRSLRLTL